MSKLRPFIRIAYKSVSAVDIPTDIYLPTITKSLTTVASKPCPILILIHGGAFMLGHAGMNNTDQIADCLDRGWIVVVPEHRLCPGVNILEGPMTDVRDALGWCQNGGLKRVLEKKSSHVVPDGERVVVAGTSSGGHLALSTAFDTPQPPLAILDFYGAIAFTDPFWTQPLHHMPSSFSDPRPQSEIDALYSEKTTFIGGVSLEGQAQQQPSEQQAEARQAFAMHVISTGKVLSTIWPSAPEDIKAIDPSLNVTSAWPPVAIVHGTADQMVPLRLSRLLEKELHNKGVEVEFIEVDGEPHTFVGKMEKGSQTWHIQRRGFDFLEKKLEESYDVIKK